MSLKHIISARQFDQTTLQIIFKLTDRLKARKYDNRRLAGKIMASLFYEPSTRTRLSFESAMQKLGGKVISTENAGEFSSVVKGETLEDTIRIINFYSDVIVIRHPNKSASATAARFSKVPIINAGDGEGEHPTQAILDLYTIFSKIKNKNFTICMMGDLAFGRTIHSLSYLLSLYPQAKILFVSPFALRIPQNLRDYLKEKKIKFEEMEDFNDGIKNADIIYQTRIQKERFTSKKEYLKYFGNYIIDQKALGLMKKNTLIMHPLPRVNEIAPEVDQDRRAIYFEQAENGLYIRMALLLLIFDRAKNYR